jgi:ParD-like antitoxin of type II bacterial toxin-antitoxin system
MSGVDATGRVDGPLVPTSSLPTSILAFDAQASTAQPRPRPIVDATAKDADHTTVRATRKRTGTHARHNVATYVAKCYACYRLLQNRGVMADTADRVTRFAADLLESAAAEGARQSRSAKQQLDHWARVGRAVSSQHSAARRRVEAALAGDLELRELGVEEGVVFNAEIAAAIQENLAESNYGELLAQRGITTVALNEAGEIIEYRPDGSSVVLKTKRRPARRRK